VDARLRRGTLAGGVQRAAARSLLFYPGGAIIVEVFYRLLPIPLVTWLVSTLALRGRGQTPVFWSMAGLTSLIEPLSQDLDALAGGPLALVTSPFGVDFVMNLVQAVMFRRFGLSSAIATRVAVYLVWHVAYGNLVCRC